MKRLSVVILTAVILSQTFINVGIAIFYNLNKEFIASSLCENRNNPQMHCNGHCFLSKQLKKAEEQGKKQAQNVLKEKIEIIADRYVECGSMHFPAYISYEFPTCPNQLHVSEFFNSLLKPPGV